MHKYGPFVALAFGFIFTIAWIAAISWFPVYFVAATILQALSLNVLGITRIADTLALFAAGIGAFGLLGWRKKRKQAA